ncbi:membrane protein [Cryptosporidium xiaoi]|uniref:Membrane protein n=1 Tax=Cryptosporidium xiaoi TaxID=659607 RepID=A0AAV9Y1Z6_9CRYT
MVVSASKDGISMLASFVLLCSSTIGTGVLVLSYGVMQAGLILGNTFILLAAICGVLTESIVALSALKLKATDLSSLIGRTVAYSVIKEKRKTMKKSTARRSINKKQSQKEVGTCSDEYRDSIEYSSYITVSDINYNKINNNETNWNEISDTESSLSDLECVRGVLVRNELLFDEFKQELRSKLLFHSRIMNMLIVVLIGYCIPTYFILFVDYVEDLLKQLIQFLAIHFYDINSIVTWVIPFINYINNKKTLNLLCFILVFYPSSQPDISKLAGLGYLSLISFILFLFSVLYRYFISPFVPSVNTASLPEIINSLNIKQFPPPKAPTPIEFGPHLGLLMAMKVFLFAIYCFDSHMICVQAIVPVKKVNPKKVIILLVSSTLTMMTICVSLSTVLNLSFGTVLLPNPTLNYSPYDTVIAAARLVLAITMLVVIPLHVIPFVDSIRNLFFLDKYIDKMIDDIEEAMIFMNEKPNNNSREESQHSVSSYFTFMDKKSNSRVGNSSIVKNSKSDSKSSYISGTDISTLSYSNKNSSFVTKFLFSTHFRVLSSFLFLMFCILLALIAKDAAQYVELLAGYFDTCIIILYPLYIYRIVWSQKVPSFINIFIHGYLIFYELCCITASTYAVYEHFFKTH